MAKNRVITVQGIPVTVSYEDIDDYICITDIAAAKSDNSRAADVIRNWLRNRSTLEFLSTWEEIAFRALEYTRHSAISLPTNQGSPSIVRVLTLPNSSLLNVVIAVVFIIIFSFNIMYR